MKRLVATLTLSLSALIAFSTVAAAQRNVTPAVDPILNDFRNAADRRRHNGGEAWPQIADAYPSAVKASPSSCTRDIPGNAALRFCWAQHQIGKRAGGGPVPVAVYIGSIWVGRVRG